MAKNLLDQIMIKASEATAYKRSFVDVDALSEKIKTGYTIKRVSKHTQKKTFAPSTVAYGHGECPRYWYIAFDGTTFSDSADAYGGANMTAGTKSHERIQEAMGNVPDFLVDSEFRITANDPPIFGFGDVILNVDGKELLGEIKTMPNEGFEYRKAAGRPKTGHLVQLLIYMKILGKEEAVLIYENKNNHELLILPVVLNDYYIKWVNGTFDWLRSVRKAWTDRTLPEKNYRSNSRICKTCPVKATCDLAGKGDIKLLSLEPINEEQALSVV
jgi:CRISPR/Cas system-associated exonuclease Cas4 (RecB family)